MNRDQPTRQRYRRWAFRAVPSLLDQGQVSIANLCVHVLLARWLSPDAYGAFAISFSLLLLATALHNALVAEPVLVFGSGRYAASFTSYLRAALAVHWATTTALGLLLGSAGLLLLLLGLPEIGGALIVLAVAQPFVLLLGLARRACYARLRPGTAALGSSIYLLVLIPGVALLSQADALGVGSALAAMAGAGLVAGACTHWRLVSATPAQGSVSDLRTIAAQHWHYGRWILSTSLATWVPSNVYYLLLPGVAGLGAAAALRAMENLVAPMLRLVAPVSMLLIPQLGRRPRKSQASFPIHRLAAGLAAAACGYWLALALLREPVVELLYGGRYADASYLVLGLGALPVFDALGGVWRAALKAQERPALVFQSYLVALVPGVAVGVLLLPALGLLAAAIGWLVFSGLSAGAAAYLLSRGIDRGRASEAERGLGRGSGVEEGIG